MQCPDCEGHGHYHPSIAMERGGDGTCERCGGSGQVEDPAPISADEGADDEDTDDLET